MSQKISNDGSDDICALELREFDKSETEDANVRAESERSINQNGKDDDYNGMIINKVSSEQEGPSAPNISSFLHGETSSNEIYSNYTVAELQGSVVGGSWISTPTIGQRTSFVTPTAHSELPPMRVLAQSTPVCTSDKSMKCNSDLATVVGFCPPLTPLAKQVAVVDSDPRGGPKAAEASLSDFSFVSPISSTLENLLLATDDAVNAEQFSQTNSLTPAIKQTNLVTDKLNLSCVAVGSPSRSFELAMVLAVDKVSASCADDSGVVSCGKLLKVFRCLIAIT